MREYGTYAYNDGTHIVEHAITLSISVFGVYIYVITILRERKRLYCWYCITDVEHILNPHLIKDMEDLLLRPETRARKRRMAMTSQGSEPKRSQRSQCRSAISRI